MNEKIPFKGRESSLGEQERARSMARAGVEEILAAFPREEAERSAKRLFAAVSIQQRGLVLENISKSSDRLIALYDRLSETFGKVGAEAALELACRVEMLLD
jgi:hypothetical protein